MSAHGAHGLLQLRLRTGGRLLWELVRAEPGTALVFLALLVLGALYVGASYGTPEGGQTLLGIQAALLGFVHGGRRDSRFLVLAGRSPGRTYVVEYLFLSAPFLLLLTLHPLFLFPAVALPLLLPWLPAGLLERSLALARNRSAWRLPLPARSFEWISGLRRHGGALVLLYAAALTLSEYPGVVLAVLVLLAWCVSLFHFDGEPWIVVEAFAPTPRRFLLEKLRRSVSLHLLLSAPLAGLFLARHPSLWEILVLVLAVGTGVHAGSVLTKYALYREGRTLGIAGYVTLLVLGGALLVPPAGLFLLYRLWRMAQRNLSFHLDDLR